jgi:murein DD-endopeptidase MepM/ murein hydrolase activator NlpD
MAWPATATTDNTRDAAAHGPPAHGPSADADLAGAPVAGSPESDRPALELRREDSLRGVGLRPLMVPIPERRPESIGSSFHDARAGGARVHRAVDIMAARGTSVLAADAGTVLRLSRNARGGITIYAADPTGAFVYYYAHLDRYAEGLHAGAPLQPGDVLGYVGSTGNADARYPHLHFQVMRRVADRPFWDGPALDPASLFTRTGRRTGPVPPMISSNRSHSP